MMLLSDYDKLHTWIQLKRKEQTGAKVYRVSDLSRNKPEGEFIELVKLFIDLNGGKQVEFNSDYSKVRIYGKKQSIFELMK